jgi:hypothetical protein
MRGKQGIDIVPDVDRRGSDAHPAPISSGRLRATGQGEPAGRSSARPAGEPERIDPDDRYWADQVARILFGRSPRWFSRHRVRLHREENFPRPISEIGRPRWSGSTLLAWQNRSPLTPGEVPSGPADMSNVINIDLALAARATQVARRRRSESV